MLDTEIRIILSVLFRLMITVDNLALSNSHSLCGIGKKKKTNESLQSEKYFSVCFGKYATNIPPYRETCRG